MKMRVVFDMEIPEWDGYAANYTQLKEWLEFILGKTSILQNTNPLIDKELAANYVRIEKMS